MARIPYVNPETAPEPVRQALGAVPPLNIFKMLGNAETAFRPFLRFGGAILGDLQLDPRLRELAILQVAKQSQAEYEWIQHVEIARHCGVEDAQIAAIEDGSAGSSADLDEVQRGVIRFTEAVVRSPHVSADDFAVVSRHLSPREIVELLLTIGNYLMLARVMTVLELELDDPAGGRVVELSREPQ
jgi:4-carboxymuconolactone decarboxylase